MKIRIREEGSVIAPKKGFGVVRRGKGNQHSVVITASGRVNNRTRRKRGVMRVHEHMIDADIEVVSSGAEGKVGRNRTSTSGVRKRCKHRKETRPSVTFSRRGRKATITVEIWV